VSIKNKLVTAVTTAGLLAGLFGSAFVPAVKADAAFTAAGADTTLRCETSANDSDVIVQGTADGTCYAKTGSTVTLIVNIEETGGTNEAGDTSSVRIDGSTGATIVSYSYDAEITLFSLFNDNNTANMNATAAATTALALVAVQVKAPSTVGGIYTYTVADQSATSTSLATLTIIAADGTKSGVASAEQSSATAVCTQGTGGTALVAGGGALCASSQVAAIPTDGIFSVNVVTEDVYGAVIASAGYVRITLTGTATGGVGLETDGNCTGFADDTTTSLQATPDGADAVCYKNDGTNGLATIVITTGPLTYTRNIMVLGGIDTVTVSGPTHMTTDDSNTDTAFHDGLGVICKDDAGNRIGDGGGEAADGETAAYHLDGDPGACIDDNLTFVVTEGDGSPVAVTDDSSGTAIIGTAARVAGEFSDENNGAAVATSSEAENNYWDIPSAVCAVGSEGETRSIKVTSGLVESNTITLTCVKNKVKITSLTALATGTSGSATSGANGQTIKVSVAATDGNGRPAGTGSSFTFTTVGTGGSTSGATASFGGGSATLTITLGTTSGAQYVLYSATDSDTATTGAQAFAQKISFTVSNSGDALVDYVLTKSGAKVTGSNFASRATVKVEVENASKGTVKLYTRKANAAGQVVYTIAGRGTFYVTMYTGAAGAEVLSNTVTVKR